jgi:hypothetical protein
MERTNRRPSPYYLALFRAKHRGARAQALPKQTVIARISISGLARANSLRMLSGALIAGYWLAQLQRKGIVDSRIGVN